MGSFTVWHWLVILVVILLLFGSNQIERLFMRVRRGAAAPRALPDAPRSWPRMPVPTPVLWLIAAILALTIIGASFFPR